MRLRSLPRIQEMSLSRFFHQKKKSCCNEEASEDDIVTIEILDSDDDEESFKGSKPVIVEENDGVQSVLLKGTPDAKVNEEENRPCSNCSNAPTGGTNNATLKTAPNDASTSDAEETVKVVTAIEPTTHEGGSTAPTIRTNPFAKFTFQKQKDNKESSASFSMPSKRPSNTALSNNSAKTVVPPAKRAKTNRKDWTRMREIAKDEQERIVTKWHSFVVHEENVVDLEDARFQILVAARLHARCQEGPVNQAMKALRDKLGEETSAFSVDTLADTDPEELHEAIRNLQYYPTKAKHIVKAAQEIRSNYRGIVPEQEFQLRQLTGIGPVMSDLLAFVNTRKVHLQRRLSDK